MSDILLGTDGDVLLGQDGDVLLGAGGGVTTQIVGILSVAGATGQETYTIPVNPQNIFSISGNQLLAPSSLANGIYPLTLQANGSGFQIKMSEVLTWLGGVPPPPPPPPPLTSTVSVFPTTLGAGQTATVYVTWNDTVFNFTLAAFAVTGGTLSNLVQGSATQFSATFLPTPNIDTAATIQVQQSGIGGAVYFNVAGSTTAASNIATVAVDTVIPPPPPLVSAISVVPNAVGVGQTATVFINWNDTVIDFTLPAFSVTAGTLSNLTEVSGTSYTALYTPPVNTVATVLIQVLQSGTGGAVYSNAAGSATQASNIARVSVNTAAAPARPFFLGLNLSGLEDTGGTPTAPEMAYWSNLGIKKFRIPLNWLQLQPVPYGPLCTQLYLGTSTTYLQQIRNVLAGAAAAGAQVMLDMSNFGGGPSKNALAFSASLAQSPWAVGQEVVANPTVTANAALAPDGLSTTATKFVFPAVPSNAASNLYQQMTNLEAGASAAYSIYLRGAVGGEKVYFWGETLLNGVRTYRGATLATLTTSWQRFYFTANPFGNAGGNGGDYFCVGIDTRDTNQSPQSGCTIYADWAQTEYGTTPTVFGPTTSVYQSSSAPGAGYLLGTSNLPSDALGHLWVTFSAALRADPHFAAVWAYDVMNEWHDMDPNSSAPSTPYSQNLIFTCNQSCVTQLRAAGDNTLVVLEWDHFDGAWDAVANNIQLQLAGIVDPANNWIQSVHNYLDQDASGTHYVASAVFGQPSTSPTGINVTVNIGQERMEAVVALATTYGIKLLVGETGWSTDTIYTGGANNFAEWNQAGFNFVSYCQANNIPVFPWASGPGFGPNNYPYDPAPFSAGLPTTKNFTTGVQGSQVVGYEQFTGYSGPQPTAYTSDINAPTGIRYTPSGTPLSGLFLYYGGVVS